MVIVAELNRDHVRFVRKTAQLLALHWGQGEGDARTLTGLCAEYAVIRYLNNCGAFPPIEFNNFENYHNGGDGGFDFRLPDDMTWDVKSTGDKELDPFQALKTSALGIIGVRRLNLYSYHIWGFAPVSRLRGKEKLVESDFQPLPLLVHAFPKYFRSYLRRDHGAPQQYLEQVGELCNQFQDVIKNRKGLRPCAK